MAKKKTAKKSVKKVVSKSKKTTKKPDKKAKKSIKAKAKNPTKKAELSEKIDRFCHEYLLDHNATQAAIRAGYSPKTARQQASRLLSKVNVLQRIEELSSKVTDSLLLSTEDIVKDLLEIKQRCMQHHEVLDKFGKKTGIYVFDAKNANTSLSKLGEYTGGFTKHLDHKNNGQKFEPTQMYLPDNGRN